ncbi:hypothetical protein [Saccharopolyspora antimicrobica]|uniref:hypothetical protein n=1 Tax=Saccharopolyspora antimicrobica TaxID=455193 RepID=UPI0015A64AA3|nr:hypothetical protein [Saccharopolyspora antimicrobica]
MNLLQRRRSGLESNCPPAIEAFRVAASGIRSMGPVPGAAALFEFLAGKGSVNRREHQRSRGSVPTVHPGA